MKKTIFWFLYIISLSFLLVLFSKFIFSPTVKTSFAENFHSNKDERIEKAIKGEIKNSYSEFDLVLPDSDAHGQDSGYHLEGTPYHKPNSNLHQSGSTYHKWPSEADENSQI